MSRADRRRFEKEFKKLPKPDNCMICGNALVHNTRTFGGLAADGSVVLAGECCERRVVTPMADSTGPRNTFNRGGVLWVDRRSG